VGLGVVPGGGEVPEAVANSFLFYLYVTRGGRGQGPAPRVDNLSVGAVSRHSLDRLNTCNDFAPQK